MKQAALIFILLILTTGFSSPALAFEGRWHEKSDTSGDHPKSFRQGFERKMKYLENGWQVFPGAEIGMGSGTLSAALGVNIGYKKGLFVVGTALKGQVINIDRVNYSLVPYTLNICGLSYSVLPETGNAQNNKKLKGRMLGYGLGGKLTFGQLVETDPDSNTKEEFLTINIGFGF